MKIIISHDVDHLYPSDHIFHDLIIPKLWIRSFFHACQKKIRWKTFFYRLGYPFYKRYHRLEEVMELDRKYCVPSIFFFGMQRGLGMSYGGEKAKKCINLVKRSGFDIGVHGVEFHDKKGIDDEYNFFHSLTGEKKFGIRMHYVRYDKETFKLLNDAGYLFDTSEFSKSGNLFKRPYKIGDMWEIPLCIMDGYIITKGDLKKSIEDTKIVIQEAEKSKIPYCTILYHDYQYNERTYPDEKKWYDWLLKYLHEQHYECISYYEALKELEENIEE